MNSNYGCIIGKCVTNKNEISKIIFLLPLKKISKTIKSLQNNLHIKIQETKIHVYLSTSVKTYTKRDIVY